MSAGPGPLRCDDQWLRGSVWRVLEMEEKSFARVEADDKCESEGGGGLVCAPAESIPDDNGIWGRSLNGAGDARDWPALEVR